MNGNKVVVVAGLSFGDEGKGTMVDALARRCRSSTVVRYNGGAQAGHNVETADGRWHCFAQFGAGSLVRTSRTFLSRHMLLDLKAMEAESEALIAKGLRAPLSRLTVDPDCVVVIPHQKFIGRMREMARGDKANGSCGMGVGEASRDNAISGLSVRVRDLLDPTEAERKLRALIKAKNAEMDALAAQCDADEVRQMREYLKDKCGAEDLAEEYGLILEHSGLTVDDGSALRESLRHRDTVIFEGAQGALLDRRDGFVPHVTQSNASMANALGLLSDAAAERPYKLGILRAYGHRHGNGPFLTEDESTRTQFDDPRNAENRWQGRFRVGWLDLPMLRYGLLINGGVDGVAITGLDRLSGLDTIKMCRDYRNVKHFAHEELSGFLKMPAADRLKMLAEYRPTYVTLPGWKEDISRVRRFEDLPKNAQDFVRCIEGRDGLNVRVDVVSVGPTAQHKMFLRK